MSAPIDTNTGWAAYQSFSAEFDSSKSGDVASAIVSMVLLVGFVVVIVLAYIPGGAA